jgi:hypothetical protein
MEGSCHPVFFRAFLECRRWAQAGLSEWTINVSPVAAVCSLHHSESGPSISLWEWLLLNLHLLGRTPIKWNAKGFQIIVIINLSH